MKHLLAFLMALSLVNVILTKPIPEDGGDEPNAEDTTQEKTNEEAGNQEKEEGDDGPPDDDSTDKEEDGESTNGKGPEKSEDKDEGDTKFDPVGTYNKVIELLDQIKVDNVEDSYERSELDADIQGYLRNPVVGAIKSVGDFSKIADCFKSMANDAKKAIEEDVKAFKECTAKKESNAYQCSQNRSSVQDKVAKISSTIASCVASKRS